MVGENQNDSVEYLRECSESELLSFLLTTDYRGKAQKAKVLFVLKERWVEEAMKSLTPKIPVLASKGGVD